MSIDIFSKVGPWKITYGRSSIRLYKIADGKYFMDFSVEHIDSGFSMAINEDSDN